MALRGMQLAAAIALLTLLPLASLIGCGKAPQISGNKKALKAADALLTAVSAQSPSLLDQCEATLSALRADDELPQTAYEYLQSVVAEARTGDWVSARRRLVKLIKAQEAPQ